MNEQPQLDPVEQKCLTDIAEHGHHVLLVADAESSTPSFAYSIGFPVSVGQSEILIYGLSIDLMHSMINEVYRQCAEGLVLVDGVRISNLIEGYDCIARKSMCRLAIDHHLGWGIWYHRTQHQAVVDEFFQIVWPGALDGLFPWNEGVDQTVIEAQPALYEVAT